MMTLFDEVHKLKPEIYSSYDISYPDQLYDNCKSYDHY